MDRRAGLALGRLVFGLLGLAAMGYQLVDLAGKGTLDPVNYFSYFTTASRWFGSSTR